MMTLSGLHYSQAGFFKITLPLHFIYLFLIFFPLMYVGDPISLVGAMGITPFQQGLVKLQGTV